MERLIQFGDQGNWCLKGVRWEQLQAGHMITLDVAEKLYDALNKLKDYEATDEIYKLMKKLVQNYEETNKIAIEDFESRRKWISVDERLPRDSKWVLVTVKCHRWISDYDTKNMPEDEKIDHPEKVYCTLGMYKKDGGWKYIDLEMDDDEPTAYFENDCRVEDLSYPMTEVIAWKLMPGIYREETEDEETD